MVYSFLVLAFFPTPRRLLLGLKHRFLQQQQTIKRLHFLRSLFVFESLLRIPPPILIYGVPHQLGRRGMPAQVFGRQRQRNNI